MTTKIDDYFSVFAPYSCRFLRHKLLNFLYTSHPKYVAGMHICLSLKSSVELIVKKYPAQKRNFFHSNYFLLNKVDLMWTL